MPEADPAPRPGMPDFSRASTADARIAEKKRVQARIDPEKCSGCGLCQKLCRFDAIEMVDGIAHVLPNCTGCGMCVRECPEEAITLEEVGVE